MDAAAVYLENSGNGKRIVACKSPPTLFLSMPFCLIGGANHFLVSPVTRKKSAANGCNIMSDSTACLDAGDAYHTFTLKNSFKPIMKKQADRSNINASKTPDNDGRSSKNGEIEAYLARHYAFRYNTVWGRGNIAAGRTADS